MLSADAGQLPSGEWVVQIVEDGKPIDTLLLGARVFAPFATRQLLKDMGYLLHPWLEATNNFLGWHMTDFGYSMQLSRMEELDKAG